MEPPKQEVNHCGINSVISINSSFAKCTFETHDASHVAKPLRTINNNDHRVDAVFCTDHQRSFIAGAAAVRRLTHTVSATAGARPSRRRAPPRHSAPPSPRCLPTRSECFSPDSPVLESWTSMVPHAFIPQQNVRDTRARARFSVSNEIRHTPGTQIVFFLPRNVPRPTARRTRQTAAP